MHWSLKQSQIQYQHIRKYKTKTINQLLTFLYSVWQGYRIFNTWMGDPSKVILLEEMVKVIHEWRLLENAATIGNRIISGLTQLQVCVQSFNQSVTPLV